MHLLRIANHLVRQHEVAIAVERRGGSYERHLASGVALIHCAPKVVKSSILGHFAALPRLATFVASWRPNIISPVLPQSAAALRWCPTGRARVVTVLQNNIASEMCSFPHLWRGYAWSGVRRTLMNSTAVIALSSGVADSARRLLPNLDVPIHVIPNAGIDDRLIARRHDHVPAGIQRLPRPWVVACGRLHPQKGFDVLLDAFARIGNRGGTLIIIGEGPRRAELQAQAERLGIAQRVVMPGFLDNPFAIFSAADVFVLSSRYEGFGNVIVEAMACGVPVVATRCPFGPEEIISQGETGLLVPVGSPDAIADAVRRVLVEPELQARLRAGGGRRAELFSAAAIGDRYRRVFESVACGVGRNVEGAHV